jgi:uncharacterized membrane protein YeaQ/YmgE (transglycosylase-associated protein family)
VLLTEHARAPPPTKESERVPQTRAPASSKVGSSALITAEEFIVTIIWAIIIGFIVGLVAKLLMPGRDPGGFIVTALLGIIGAVVASFIGQAMGIYAAGQSAGFIGAVIGAIIVLAIYHMVRGRRTVV